MLACSILDVSLLRIRYVRTGGRSRVGGGHVVLGLLGLLHVSWSLFGREICVTAHGDGVAGSGSSSHVSVLLQRERRSGKVWEAHS